MPKRRLLDIRRRHLLAATAEIAGRPVELLFTVRENFGGQCFLEGVTAPNALDRRRQDGGNTPDDLSSDAPGDTDDAAPNDAAVMADAGQTSSAAAPAASDSPRVKTASPGANWLDPKGRYAQFFDQQFAPAAEVAAQLGIDPALLLGLSAHESGYGMPLDRSGKPMKNDNYTKNLNPFGATPLGDKTSGLAFPSYRDAWQAWAKMFGPRVAGVGSDAAAFLRNLEYDNRNVYGPTIGGNYQGAYNSEDRAWKDEVAEVIKGVRKRLPLWQGNLDSLP